MLCLGNEQRSFVIFEIAPMCYILNPFVDHDDYSISSKGFLPTVVDKMVIWIKVTHPIHFHFTLTHRPNILGSCAILLFMASDSTFTTSSVQFSSVSQSCPILCDPMNCSTPGLPVHHQLLESTQTHVHCVGDVIQPSHPLLSPSPPALNLSPHQGLFK